MRDEMFDRDYQWGRADLSAGIDRGVHAIGRFVSTTFDAIHDVQFAAPWRRSAAAKPAARTGLA